VLGPRKCTPIRPPEQLFRIKTTLLIVIVY
jgi:hypothetical protein